MLNVRTTHIALLLFAILFVDAARGEELSRADRAAIDKVLHAYVSRWLVGDAQGVMSLLTPDSVLIPGEKPPLAGRETIRNYWFPSSGPRTTVERYTTTRDQVIGARGSASVRGTQVIEWTTSGERWRTSGNYLTVLKRTPDGWRIAIQMAANGANERVK